MCKPRPITTHRTLSIRLLNSLWKSFMLAQNLNVGCPFFLLLFFCLLLLFLFVCCFVSFSLSFLTFILFCYIWFRKNNLCLAAHDLASIVTREQCLLLLFFFFFLCFFLVFSVVDKGFSGLELSFWPFFFLLATVMSILKLLICFFPFILLKFYLICQVSFIIVLIFLTLSYVILFMRT